MTDMLIDGLNVAEHAAEDLGHAGGQAGGHGTSFADTAAHPDGSPPHPGEAAGATHAGEASSSWWDRAVSGVKSAAGSVDSAVHSAGHAVDQAAEAGIAKTTDAVRSVAGDRAANLVHGAAEGVRDQARQTAGFVYGAGAGATEALGGMVEGTGNLVRSGAKFATDSQFRGQVVHGAEKLGSEVAQHPLASAKALGSGVVHSGEDWLRGAGRAAQEGNLGEYVGRGAGSAVVNVGSFFIPGADVAEGANVASHLGEAGELASGAARALQTGGKVAEEAGTVERAAGGAERAASQLGETGAGVERSSETAEHAAAGEHAEAPATPNLRERNFTDLDEFNAAANKAEPNTTYKFGDHSWTTDERGRTIEATGKVRVHEFGRNDTTLQTQIGKEGKPTDIGFHLIADSLDGPTNRLNVVPGNGRPIGDGLPNLNQGTYKKFENAVRNLANSSDKPVEIRIRPQYDAANTTSRPDRFVAEFREQGGAWAQRILENK